MFRNRLLPELAVGDRIAVMDAGAYFIPNQMNFSNPRPAVVMIRGEEVSVIRARESFEDIVSLDHWSAISAT
jgi:diaminopimelate decarboxylase